MIEFQALRDTRHPLWSGRRCTPSLRARVVKAFKGRCEYCGVRCGYENHPSRWPTVDKILPAGLGGRYVDDNIALACLSCNSRKSDSTWFVGPVRSLSQREGRS